MATAREAPRDCAAAICRLFETAENSDIQIRCGKRIFNVHKCIIASQGGFFATKKEAFQEGQAQVLDVSDDEEDEVEAVLKHLYGIAYEVPKARSSSAASFHASVYAVGEFYQLPGLKEAAKKRFEMIAFNGKEGALSAFTATKSVYHAVPEHDRGLKDILVRVIDMYLDGTIHNNKANQLILKDVPELAYDLVIKRASAFADFKIPQKGGLFGTPEARAPSYTTNILFSGTTAAPSSTNSASSLFSHPASRPKPTQSGPVPSMFGQGTRSSNLSATPPAS